MMQRLYSDPAEPSAFSSLHKLRKAVKHASSKQQIKTLKPSQIKSWLQTQDAYTMHRPVRKRFERNPYTVSNINDVWEIDILDLSSLKKYNDNHKYLLQVIDVFSKYLHSVPMRTKTGKEVAAAFESILRDPKYTKPIRRRPVWVRTDKGKEFLNSQCQALLKREGIEFQVCRNPDVKCSIVERVNRTVRDKLYKYFTHRNTYRYIDVLPKFVIGYNASIHSTTGIAPSSVRDTDVLAIWNRMKEKADKAKRLDKLKFRVGQHVRISKEKVKFAKGGEQNYTTEIFKVRKVVRRTPRPVFELEDLRGQEIEGQFYTEELSPVRISKQTTYKIDKILGKRVRRGILEYLVRWKGYSADFDSWVPASDIQRV